ncbi:2-phosphosulfolactate phosphatase [Deinococcus sp. YIM 77859]|uniref:2-phosphosulfolactate phosphatase n=1 Tax=Deinococcus sp. YIM 77859 TaxID=1540221 RepID=UPI000554D016|nr:2-phosphosulfolactate phosphatase [Deinococcus sp. YIM 77859]
MFWAQDEHGVRLEWGEPGVQHLAPWADAVVIVDVLSFSTAVDVGVSGGAAVLPFRWRDTRAATFAAAQGAVLAGDRDSGGPTLSPASLLGLPPGTRLVLPSPNGGTLCALAQESSRAVVVAACLRNAGAVGEWLRGRFARVLVVPAGERWPGGTLRPALEDSLGAGAVVEALCRSPGLSPSPEAAGARATFQALRKRLPELLSGCASGLELMGRGFPEDVTLAAELNVSSCVPVLQEGAFVNGVSPSHA